MPAFKEFGKIARLNRDIVITEKIDGTNAQIYIASPLEAGYDNEEGLELTRVGDYLVWAGSRNRWLQPGKPDNFGFACWVDANAPVLVAVLGPGRHFGEWWGAGIQRRYGLVEKRFSLFNVSKWGWLSDPQARVARPEIPAQLGVVPVLYRGPWFTKIDEHPHVDGRIWAPYLALDQLLSRGSAAAPGFLDPEGVVVFHEASGQLFKATSRGDEEPKGQTA